MPLAREIIDQTLGTKAGEAAQKISETLQKEGFEAYWVGGAVRDMLLGKLPKDIDIATSALPADVAKLFQRNDDSAANLGTVVVAVDGQNIEVTTFREDIGIRAQRRPEEVKFVDRTRDAKRRDFTINALYWNSVTGELIDDFEGQKDIGERLVRFIGDPDTRIQEDALRILRGVRLRASIAGQYHPETYEAMRSHAKETANLSGSRIFAELERMLLTQKPSVALEDLWELEVLKSICPELYRCKGVAQPMDFHKEGDVWNHLLQCADAANTDHGPDVRLAALFHDVGKAETFTQAERIRFDHHATVSAEICSKVLGRWQCPKLRVQKLDWLIRHHMTVSNFAEMNDERKSHWYYHPWFTELLQLFWLDIAGTTPPRFGLYDSLIADYNAFLDAHPRPPKPILSGEHVMKLLGIGQGEQVGKVLADLYALQIEGKITGKKEAEAHVKNTYTKSTGQ